MSEAEQFNKDVIDDKALEKLKAALDLTEDGLCKVQQFLYINLLQYTKGDSHSRIVADGRSQALESYRQVVVKGKNATVTSLIDQRFRIMQPEKSQDS